MKIFLAGTFGERKHPEVLQSPYILESFFYYAPWQEKLLHTTKDFLLDSGAFTFMMGNGGKANWEEYIERYAEFIKKNNIKNYFELDIDSVVGYEKVKDLRKKLEKMTNRPCIPVWHLSRGIQEYKKMCDEYGYVAIGGIVSGEITKANYKAFPALISEAHKRKAMVHGLGFTNVTYLPHYHFDSVDSTRWNCARYGRVEYFDGKTMRVVDKRKEGMRVVGGSEADTTGFTIKEWIKFQQYAEKHL